MRLATPAIVLTLLSAGSASAQQADIYANPKNLEVLPKDIGPEELSETMRGFTFALDARCSSCHVGEEGQPLTEYDFAADDKPMKRSARSMLRMVAAINKEYLSELADDRREGITVGCMTCHRGQDRPRLIEDVLDLQIGEDGVDAAIAEYRSLRERYFGSHTFDFSETPINEYALRLAKRGEGEAALQLIDMNLDYYPESFSGHWYKARIQSAEGDLSGAIASLEAAIKLSPENEAFLRQQVDRLKERQAAQDQ